MTEGRLWGGRFAQTPDDAAWALGRSVDVDWRLWPHDLDGSIAHAGELVRIGILDEQQHDVITRALEQIRAEFQDGAFAFAHDDEDLHGAIERRLVELCGATGGRLRAGRSRNDQVASDLRLYLAEQTQQIVTEVRELQRALVDQAEAAIDWIAPGYTHLQRAQPVTLGHHLLAHAWALDRDVERFGDARGRMLSASPLGAGALAGSTLPLDPEHYARALGYTGVGANSMDAVADRDFAVEFLAAAALLSTHCSRLGEEIVLWCSSEFGWCRVGDAFSTGSSIMPQKRNPDVAELVRGQTGRIVGDLVSLLITLKGLPLTYNRDLQEDKPPVFDAVDTLGLALPAMTGSVRSLTFDRDRLQQAAAGGFSLATDLAEELVRRGVPFRVAHERVGEVVAACESKGEDLTDLSPGDLVDLIPDLDGADVSALTDAAAAVARRGSSFGPSPERVAEQVSALRRRLDEGTSESGLPQ